MIHYELAQREKWLFFLSTISAVKIWKYPQTANRQQFSFVERWYSVTVQHALGVPGILVHNPCWATIATWSPRTKVSNIIISTRSKMQLFYPQVKLCRGCLLLPKRNLMKGLCVFNENKFGNRWYFKGGFSCFKCKMCKADWKKHCQIVLNFRFLRTCAFLQRT